MTENRRIVVTREFAAPRAAVFRAWTVPSELEWFLNPDQPRPDVPAATGVIWPTSNWPMPSHATRPKGPSSSEWRYL